MLAFVIVVPLGIIGGVIAALYEGRGTDRIISVTGLSLSSVPEFVSGIVLIVVFGVELKWLPVTASAGAGASALNQFRHLILPAIPLVFVLFGYIARMARAGTIEALNSDYARTAVLKGLPQATVIRRHVLRNSLLPTITVIATQTGYLIGGLVVVETLFNYQGLGNLIYKAAVAHDFPMMEAGVLRHRRGLRAGHAGRGHAADLPQPAAADRGHGMSAPPPPASAASPLIRLRLPIVRAGISGRPDRQRWRPPAGPRRPGGGCCCARPTFFVGAGVLLFWVVCAVFGHLFVPYNPLAQQLLFANTAPSSAHWFGTDPLGRDVLSRVIVGARDILIITPLATVIGTILGTALGLAMGYFGGAFDLVISRIVEAVPRAALRDHRVPVRRRHRPVRSGSITIIIGLVFTPLIARTVRAAVLVERHQDYVSASRLLGEGPARVMFGEILPNVMPAIVVEFTVRLGYAVFAVVTLSFLGFGIQPPTPDWGADIAANYSGLLSGYWWQTLFPALAIASLVTAVVLIADSIEQVLSA